LPVTNFQEITIPGLAADLDAVHAAWQDGELERTRSWMEKMTLRLVGAGVLVVLAGVVVWRRRRAKK
jgi:heme A synthase